MNPFVELMPFSIKIYALFQKAQKTFVFCAFFFLFYGFSSSPYFFKHLFIKSEVRIHRKVKAALKIIGLFFVLDIRSYRRLAAITIAYTV